MIASSSSSKNRDGRLPRFTKTGIGKDISTQAGQIAATAVAIPLNYLAEEAGFNVIGRLIDAVPDFELTVIATKRSWAEKNHASMLRFMKGMAQATRWLYDTKEPASTSSRAKCN